MTSRDLQRCCEAVRSAILGTAWLLVGPAERLCALAMRMAVQSKKHCTAVHTASAHLNVLYLM